MIVSSLNIHVKYQVQNTSKWLTHFEFFLFYILYFSPNHIKVSDAVLFTLLTHLCDFTRSIILEEPPQSKSYSLDTLIICRFVWFQKKSSCLLWASWSNSVLFDLTVTQVMSPFSTVVTHCSWFVFPASDWNLNPFGVFFVDNICCDVNVLRISINVFIYLV